MEQTVYYNPITPIYENMAPGTVVVGSPGAGKSYFLTTIFRNMLMQRCRILAIDPKNDMRSICKIAPIVRDVDISKGVCMDPFKCIRNLDTNFIISLISVIVGGLTNEQKTEITPIVRDFVNRSKTRADTSFKKFVDYLYQSPKHHAMDIGNMLKANEDSEVGSVLFDSKGEILDVFNSSCVFTLNGLPLPKHDRFEDWTESERFASGICMILIKNLNDILRNNKENGNIPTLLVIDEAHIVLSNPEIYRVAEQFLILGRSLNVATLLASQNVNHFPEDFSNYITNKFIFRSMKDNAVEFFNRFSTQGNENYNYLIESITKLNNGECLYMDRFGRNAFIHIDSDLGVSSNPYAKK